MERKIFIAGSIIFDLVVRAERYPNKGESLIGKSFGMFCGGKGANQALQVKKFKKEVVFLGKVGNDYFGEKLRENLKKEGIDTKYIFTDKKNFSGCAVIVVDKYGTSSIVVVPGANMFITSSELEKVKSEIISSDLVLLQLEISWEVVKEIIYLAHRHKIFTILNPAPARKIPSSLFPKCNIITPNEIEAKIITDEYSIDKAVDKLLKWGAKNVIITLGERGCLLATSHEREFFPAFKVKAVDTTACGDAFSSALAVGIVEGKSIKDAIKFAQGAAALAATKEGASPSLPTREEVDNFLKRR